SCSLFQFMPIAWSRIFPSLPVLASLPTRRSSDLVPRRTVRGAQGDGVGAVLESAQCEEVLAEGLPQLVLPRDPERLVLLHGVQRPFGGAVEAEYHAAAAARPGLDDHRGEHERLVPQLSVVDDEQVAVGRRPGEPGLTETACDVDVDHVPNLRPMAPERTGWGLERSAGRGAARPVVLCRRMHLETGAGAGWEAGRCDQPARRESKHTRRICPNRGDRHEPGTYS